MWQCLSKRQLGAKFNRQHIVGDYIVDFVCLDYALVVEVDGAYHSEYVQIQKDEQRTEKLNAMGFQVLRFSNEEILFETENTINKLKEELINKDLYGG